MKAARLDPCPHCDTHVIWAIRIDTDEPIPLEPEPAADGTIEIVQHAIRFGRRRPLVRLVDDPDMFDTTHYHPHQCTPEVAA